MADTDDAVYEQDIFLVNSFFCLQFYFSLMIINIKL
ncbi:hypothetical protein L950_0219540 [Sphingobacterium sp. IITKGP-BTPF85]|nr:hypothetical protein L950_0219540 [Sphingobacterium sp. IITKGP-BTPF85]